MTAEIDLLTLCARTNLARDSAMCIRGLLKQICWETTLALGTRHRVLPLLYWNLSCVQGEAEPAADGHIELLAKHFLENAARSMELVEDIASIVKAFEYEKVRAIPFKGVALASLVYGNIALRETGDLDFLIRKQDRMRGKRILESLGYHLTTSVNQRGIPTKSGEYEYHFEQQGKTPVELRWRITQGQFASELDFDLIAPRCRSVALGQSQVQAIAPEDLVLILCTHGAKHRWGTLMWICDISELLRACPKLDWNAVRSRAEQMGLWRVTALGLLLSWEILEAPLPEKILTEVQRDAIAMRLALAIKSHLFDPAKGFSEPRYHELIVERRRDRLWNFSRNLGKRVRPNHRDRDFVRLPSRLNWAHYLVRPIRLIYEQFSSLAPSGNH